MPNIIETASAAYSFTSLMKAVRAAGMVDSLSGPGPYTIFAPADPAFNAIPREEFHSLLSPEFRAALVNMLRLHVAPGRIRVADLAGLEFVPTLLGQNLTVAHDAAVTLNGATLIGADIECSNGIIHVLDSVLVPAF